MDKKKKIRLETPLSVTSTENAIFEVVQDIVCLVDMDGVSNNGFEEINEIKAGSRWRLLGCKLPASGHAPFRYGDANAVIYIPISKVKYVAGNLGDRYNGQYDE